MPIWPSQLSLSSLTLYLLLLHIPRIFKNASLRYFRAAGFWYFRHIPLLDTQYTIPGRVSRALTPPASGPLALVTTRVCPQGLCPALPVWAAASASTQPRYIPMAATGCTATPRRSPGIDSKVEKQRRRLNKAWYF